MKLSKLFVSTIGALGLCAPIPYICTNNSNNVINSNNKLLKNDESVISKVFQRLAWHGSGWDVNVDNIKSKDIQFTQTFKKIYTAGNNKLIDGNCFIESLDQISEISGGRQTGSYRWGDEKYDLNTRVQDWKFPYLDNLRIKSDSANINWGSYDEPLYLVNKNIWPKGKNYHNIEGKVVFAHGSEQSYEYQSSKDVSLYKGVNRNFVNKSFEVYGIPYSKLKEAQYVYVVDNFVRRYLWMLSGNETHDSLAKVDSNKNVDVNAFKIKDLITLSKPSYKKGTVVVKFNSEFINVTKQIYDVWKMYEKSNHNDALKWGIENNYVLADNFSSIVKYLNTNNLSTIDCQNYIKLHQSSYTNIINKYNLTSDKTIYQNLSDLIDHISINLHYQTPSTDNCNIYENVSVNVSNDELKKGKEIILNKNSEGDYEMKLTNLHSNEFLNPTLYIQPDDVNQINCSNTNITQKDDSFYITKPKYLKVNFNEEAVGTLSDKYTYDLSNQDILKNFVNLIDNYGEECDGTFLTENDYEIIRDEFNGIIYVSVNLNDTSYAKEIKGFKPFKISNYNFDANKYESEILPANVNNEIIDDILVANNFDKNIADSCKWESISTDAKNGKVKFKIKDSLNLDFYQALKSKTFTINNLLKYYISQKQNVNSKYLKLKPSQITESTFIKQFLDCSEEFLGLNNLEVKLNPNDKAKTLKVEINYTDYFSKEKQTLNYEYKFLSSKSWFSKYWLLGLIGIGVLGLFIGLYLYKRDNYKKM